MKNKYNESIVSSLSNYSIILGISSLIHKRKVNIQEIYNEYGKDYIDAFHNIQKTTANNVFIITSEMNEVYKQMVEYSEIY